MRPPSCSCNLPSTLTFFPTIGPRSKSNVGGGHAKLKAGLRTSRNKSHTISVIDSDSTDISELNSESDHDGKGNDSGKESDGDMGQGSDDDFDRAKLTEKDAKQVLNDKVIFLLFCFFLLNCPL